MINSDKYIDIVERKVIPDMRSVFPDSGVIFQQNLDTCPSSEKVKTICRKQIKCVKVVNA